jgi:hypothetical protein
MSTSLFARYSRPHSTLSLSQISESSRLRHIYQSIHQTALDPLDRSSGTRSKSASKGNEPIADFDAEPTLNKQKLARPDLTLPTTPLLPLPNAHDFSSSLSAKLEVVKAEYWFDDGDRDVAARKTKSAVLAELPYTSYKPE